MTTLADLVSAYTRTPTASAYLDGRRWYGIQRLRYGQRFGENIAGGGVEGRDPPVEPRVGMDIRWTWGYNGIERPGLTGQIAKRDITSYPNTWKLECKDTLWRADKSQQVLQTDPLNEITAQAAVIYLLTHYGGIPASKIQIPSLNASGAAWVGSAWVLGVLTPVQWGDSENNSGGTTALRAAAEICSCLGYWLYCDSGGIIRAKQMEKKPSPTAREVFQRASTLLVQGAPVRTQDYEKVFNQVTVRGANTGFEGVQLYDQRQTSSVLLPSGVYRDFSFSSFLLEYENDSDAGAASVSSVATRILNVVSRVPDEETHRAKADPDRKVGDTVGLIDAAVGLGTQKNYFIYAIDRTLDLQTGAFDDQLSLDGGTGSTGYTTVPPPDASFSWTLMAEAIDGVAVVEVFLDGSASSSSSGAIVSWAWSTSTPTYGATPDTASGVHAVLIFEVSDGPAVITLIVTDTTSKTSQFDAEIDLFGAGSAPPLREVVSGAAGSAWYVTPDGGAAWRVEATGDATSVGTIGAGADARAAGSGGAYGLLATVGSGGTGLRQTIDTLLTPSVSLLAAGGAITSNIWVNEANPARVWFAVGTAVYRSIDGGVTAVAMAAAPAPVSWIMEDAAVENSVFIACGPDLLHATDPTLGWAMLYPGPLGATARQFVRSRDGQVTWVCYTGAPAGESLQRVENGAAADFDATDVRTLALDRNASAFLATVYGITGDDPAQIWAFDGLTGLSAVQSARTFPAGATVQHMLTSRLFDVIYTAEFDSIAPGQGSFSKYFPLPDQLLRWKQLSGGEQGHMLGLGARVASAASIILLPYGASGAADQFFLYEATTSLWRAIEPPIANAYWLRLAANPFAPNSWLALGNSAVAGAPGYFAVAGGLITMQDGATTPLWRTDDGGATWTPIDLPIALPDAAAGANTAIAWVEWSATDGTIWYTARQNGATATSLWRGTGTTAAAVVTDTTTTAYLSLIPGLDGDVYFPPSSSSGNPKLGIYVDASNAWTVPPGASLGSADGTNVPYADRFPLDRRVLMTTFDDILYGTPDYRTAQPTLIVGVGGSVAIVGNDAYIGSGGGVKKVTDPFGAATVTQAYQDASVQVGVIRSDRQTQSACAVYVLGSGVPIAIGVLNGASWITLALPPDADPTKLFDYIEVVVTR